MKLVLLHERWWESIEENKHDKVDKNLKRNL